jgi:hypothetical protein
VSDDFSELLELAADLSAAPVDASRFVKKAVQFTATEIKQDWRQGAERTGLTGYAASVDYDMKYPGGAIEAEIGPNLGRNQGSFGFVEDAGGGVRSAPQHAGRDAVRANEDDFVRGLEIAILDAMTKAVGG